MSLPRSLSHNIPANPRNKPQTIPKRKKNTRNKGISNSMRAQADGPRRPGGLSVWRRWTVREVAADSPQKPTEPPVSHPEKRIVCALSLYNPRATRAARTVRDDPADDPRNYFQLQTTGKTDRNERAQEHMTNTKNNLSDRASRTSAR
jgi:hypothetical protein